MKLSAIVALLLGMVFSLGSSTSMAHRTEFGVGVFVGPPVVVPVWPAPRRYYEPAPWPYYYYPYPQPGVVVVPPPAPPVYVEQNPPPDNATAYWYYCSDSKAYYPYVKECPGGWQKVLPQPEK